MADQSFNNLEEQLRQDRRLGKTRRRKRRLRRLLPFVILLALLALLFFVLRGEREPTPTETEMLPPGSSSATISFVGDINLDQQMMLSFRVGADYDFSPLFRRITARLTSADLTVGNFEGSLTGSDEVSEHNYPAALLRDLYAAGFDILQTANSYSIQNGITGLSETKQAIAEAGMIPLGTWSSPEDRALNPVLIQEVNGIRFAFLAFTKGMNNLRLPVGAEYCVNLLYQDYDTNYTQLDRESIISAVNQARLLSPDVIIAMVHWGSEYDREIAQSQKEAAELLFDCGVHLVIGSHSHYVGPMELRSRNISPMGGSFLAYSLGDFVSIADNSSARNGCILSVSFLKDGSDLSISRLEYTPIYSAAPSEELEIKSYEILDTMDAISFYDSGYYDRVSEKLYDRLVTAVEKMKEQTGLGEYQTGK
jgi:Putative enzyme of poly-gamma-glutamate biosynthesis (capsule formation)